MRTAGWASGHPTGEVRAGQTSHAATSSRALTLRGPMRSNEPTQSGAARIPSETGPGTPVRLGLALSGGGFRATLFHLGLLVRLAELDLHRHLHVISAVSGGSILAAHYMLRLKAALEASPAGRLSREEYLGLVDRVRSELRQAVA